MPGAAPAACVTGTVTYPTGSVTAVSAKTFDKMAATVATPVKIESWIFILKDGWIFLVGKSRLEDSGKFVKIFFDFF